MTWRDLIKTKLTIATKFKTSKHTINTTFVPPVPRSLRPTNNPLKPFSLSKILSLCQFSMPPKSHTIMKASFKAKADADKSGAACTLVVNGGDVKLRASMTDATFLNGPTLTGLSLSLEKPGSFMIDYNVPKKDVRFQFMNTVKVLEKPLNLTYTHSRGDNRTVLDGMLVLDPANKLSANYAFDSANCKLKYSYVHGEVRTFEPSYDFAKNSWDFAVSQRVFDDDVFRALYQTSSKVLGLEWSRMSKFNGAFKISASLDLTEELKMPKLTAESTWNFEM